MIQTGEQTTGTREIEWSGHKVTLCSVRNLEGNHVIRGIEDGTTVQLGRPEPRIPEGKSIHDLAVYFRRRAGVEGGDVEICVTTAYTIGRWGPSDGVSR